MSEPIKFEYIVLNTGEVGTRITYVPKSNASSCYKNRVIQSHVITEEEASWGHNALKRVYPLSESHS